MYHIFQDAEDGWVCFVNGSTISMWVEEMPELLDVIDTMTNPSYLHKTPEQIADTMFSTRVTHLLCSVEKLSDLKQLYPELFI